MRGEVGSACQHSHSEFPAPRYFTPNSSLWKLGVRSGGDLPHISFTSTLILLWIAVDVGMAQAHRFAYIDRCCYDAKNDLVILASYLNDGTKHTPTPAYDCAANRWSELDLGYETGKRSNRTTRAFPHGRSCGIVHDPKRALIWGADTHSQVYVLHLSYDRSGVN